MQHLIQFTFDFEDDNIRKKIESGIEKQIVSKIQNDIQKEYFAKRWGDDPIANMVSSQVKVIVEGNKDLIIEKASKILAEKISRKKGTTDAVINGAIEESREGKGDGI